MPEQKQINYPVAIRAAEKLGTLAAFENILSQIESLAGPDDPAHGERSAQRRAYTDNNAPHFTFFTNRDDVAIPDHLLSKFPRIITLVVQHQFSNLRVEADRFVVSMEFNKQPFDITVPYDAIIQVTDKKQPTAGFARMDYIAMLEAEQQQEDPRPNAGGARPNPPRSDKPGAPGNGSGSGNKS